MEASHKTHRPHIKVGKDEEEEDISNSIGDISNSIGDIYKYCLFADIYNSIGDIYKYCLFADIYNSIGDIYNSAANVALVNKI